jgi:hypothetical protein
MLDVVGAVFILILNKNATANTRSATLLVFSYTLYKNTKFVDFVCLFVCFGSRVRILVELTIHLFHEATMLLF